ncbi:S-layer homology domain-containing protein [Thiolapillus brandeum]|uniref:SLH domain-containing protein n=1 Tax=Thiolapillus brandeum TaxID=1076588 RepID=A0A7U6GK37_9GAMM|nr:S-layer homology domain-containing protein [Thiolapillus brandeum]BAO45120.1 hypothetical protein TBH_C2209 [Thiolapillus brandeum]
MKFWMAAAPLLLGSLFTNSAMACSTAAWSHVENPEVTLFARPESRCTGGCGLRIKLNGTQPAYVEDDTPGNLAEDVTAYYAKFHLDTTWLNMNDGQKITVFMTSASGAAPAFGLEVVQIAGKKYARIFAHRDDGSQVAANSAASELSDGWHTIELMWNAASAAGANDGSLSLALDDVDGVLNLSSLDNDTHAILTSQLGVIAGNDANVTGNLHIDAFTSQRTASTATPEACIAYGQLFSDIPTWHNFYSWIQSIGYASIASGCTATNYCADNNVTRAQMAVFLERGMNGGDYQPPAGTGAQFDDVPSSHWAVSWVEKFASDGITTGCGGSNFCPESNVDRTQMAVFLLRAEHGAAYTPPAATGTMFNDVSASTPNAAWIEQLASEGITGGCGDGNYCPTASVTRGQMAVFVQRAFDLPLRN